MGYEASVMFEHRFWLQVFGDHARFIKSSLSPDEKKRKLRGRSILSVCLTSCIVWWLQARRPEICQPKPGRLQGDRRSQNLQATFVKKRHLTEPKLGLHLPPTFVNHMMNEAEEALRTYRPIASGENVPVFSDIHLHLLWLLDAVGHSDSMDAALDPVEKKPEEQIEGIRQAVSAFFYMKAVEMAGYLRTTLTQFPSLSRFNKEVELEMLLFRRFLNELAELDLKAETLGTLMPLMADHMAREECYYLIKLSLVSEVEPPNCDPGKPESNSRIR